MLLNWTAGKTRLFNENSIDTVVLRRRYIGLVLLIEVTTGGTVGRNSNQNQVTNSNALSNLEQ